MSEESRVAEDHGPVHDSQRCDRRDQQVDAFFVKLHADHVPVLYGKLPMNLAKPVNGAIGRPVKSVEACTARSGLTPQHSQDEF
jgi:hypothetical protein